MLRNGFSLDDKYRTHGTLFLTGIQALVRLPLLQRERDALAGLHTAGFISGYRGSPLGGLDQNFVKAKSYLQAANIEFRFGLNEDLAATAVWGSQQVNLFPGAKYGGVFALWYGKGPGVDRCGDVFRHGNAAGTSRHGGVLLVAGDDHAAKSSSLPHQTDPLFAALMIPVLQPATVQEVLDYGIHGWAMSRYSGCWVALKTIAETVESASVVEVNPQRVTTIWPQDEPLPMQGLNLRWPDPPLVQEQRLLNDKIYAVLAYARANQLNQVLIDCPQARLGILASGKAYLDVMQALADLGIDAQHAAEMGLRVGKIGLIWPLEPDFIHQFAQGLEEILVVEEKRALLESQLKEQLYNWQEDVRPIVVGKFDERSLWTHPHGEWLLPAAGELTPTQVAQAIAQRISRFYTSPILRARLAFLADKAQALAQPRAYLPRLPYFCSGCPHNTSTQVPDGSRAMAGIGCHYMATWINPDTKLFTQMGGEGVPWIGQAPFTETAHIFANLGDGTYYHSGILAIRAAVAAQVNITYKILYNDAVAMTGGQAVDGPLDVPMLTRQLAAENVEKIVICSDAPEKYHGLFGVLAAGVTVHHRDQLDTLQRQLREIPGVSVLIYEQTCAAEKRRRRKRGRYPDPDQRVVIHEDVCEGCGDCHKKSHCLSVVPVETAWGRKRQIDQSGCNKDFSCLNGFCPSLVTLEGARTREHALTPVALNALPPLPLPELPALNQPYGVLVAGVGGTGIITVGALLGVAAHLDGLGVTVLDMTGLAQKGGAVLSHVRFAHDPAQLYAPRIAAGEANLVLAADLAVAASDEALLRMRAGVTHVVLNTHEAPTGALMDRPDLDVPSIAMQESVRQMVGDGALSVVNASRLATALLGDAMATNLFLLGFAWQRGQVPVSLAAIEQAIVLNDTAVKTSLDSFAWGRHAAHQLVAVEAIAQADAPPAEPLPEGLDALISHRMAWLTAYQHAALARRYQAQVQAVAAGEQAVSSGQALTRAVAQVYAQLLAYKDEYEVARLFSQPQFHQRLRQQFTGNFKVVLHFAPTWLTGSDPQVKKRRLSGRWVWWALRVLQHGKVLRGTVFDPFGWQAERQEERRLIQDYERTIAQLLANLRPDNLAQAIEIARLPGQIRGYGTVKLAAIAAIRPQWQKKLAAYQQAQAVHPVHFMRVVR